MKIAINAAFNPTGGAITQLVNMARYMPSSDNNLNLVIYVNKKTLNMLKEEGNILENYKIVVCSIPGISVIFRILWEQLILPFSLISENIDVLFCPGNIAPLFSKCKTVLWIGTIGPFYKEFYQNFSLSNRIKLFINKTLMIASASRSDAIIFLSNFTKKLFIDSYGIKSDRSHVINIGKDLFFYPFESTDDNCLLNKYELFSPYALCVSHLYPYKNIARMLDAFGVALDHTGVNLKLLIAGSKNYRYYTEEILGTIERLSIQESVLLLGSVSKEDLRYLYSQCAFMIFPSPYENFASTLVEAMCCGAAIICSNTTAMPETCQEAAMYFDPNNTEEMAEKIELLINDEDLRKSLSHKSLERVKELPDYKEVTTKTLDVIKNLVDTN